MLRTCKDCQIQKNIDEFYKKNYKKNNYVWIAHTCSECKKNKDREYFKKLYFKKKNKKLSKNLLK